jgi:probable HAF family extracellular repeat protein
MNPVKTRLVIFVMLALGAARGAAAQYVPIDLGPLGPASYALAVNESGQVVGEIISINAETGNGEAHAFSWTADGGMIDLGILGFAPPPAVGNGSVALAVSDNGQVVGTSSTSGRGIRHAFSWTAVGGMVDLTPAGDIQSSAADVNNSGQVVGISFVPGNGDHAFSWYTTADGRLLEPVDLGTLGGTVSTARAVNASGQVVGSSFTAGNVESHAISWTALGGMVDLATLRGGFSYANDVSNSGQVVGVISPTQDGATTAFSWTPSGGMVDLGTLGGASSYATAVNESGQVVGYSSTANGEEHAFSWTAGGGMVDLGTLGGTESRAAAVNSNGQVVGWSTTAGNDATHAHAFSWTADGGMVGLPELADDGHSLATAVNNHGQVVGSSSTLEFDGHATMWVPVTVPSALDQLIAQVTAFGLPKGLTNALTVKLEAALASWQRGRSNAAVNQIGAFIHEVDAKRGKALTDAQADTLIRIAEIVVQAIRSEG